MKLARSMFVVVYLVAGACTVSGEEKQLGEGDGDGDGDHPGGATGDGDAPSSDNGDGDGDGDADTGSGGAPASGGQPDHPSGGSDPRDVLDEAKSFCDKYGDAVCDWRLGCGNEDSCADWPGHQRMVAACDEAIVALELGTVRFEPDLAQECIELAQGYDLCSGGPPFNSLQVRDVCEKVFRGTRAFDEACRSASFAATYDECQEGYCLREVDDFGFVACEGTCTSFQLEDHSCVQQQRCAPGLYCWDSTCVVPAVEGESCAAWPCASGLICGGSPATCRDPGPPGTTCEDNYDCAQGGLCNDGQCVINVAEGELCLQDATCQSGLYCRPTGVSGESRCAAPVAPYDDCDGLYDRCVGDYACSADLECVPLLSPLGAPCGPGGCEAGLWCDENQSPPTCAEARDEGGDCTWYASCRSGLLCMPDLKCHPPGQQGEICALDSAGSCAAGLFCDRETTLCQPVRALGQPCNPLLTHDSCQDGLYCACLAAACPSISTAHDPADVCAALKADGESCERETECENGQCLGGECSTSPEAPDCSR